MVKRTPLCLWKNYHEHSDEEVKRMEGAVVNEVDLLYNWAFVLVDMQSLLFVCLLTAFPFFLDTW